MKAATSGILALLLTVCNGELIGLRFLDNNRTMPWIQENGNSTITFSPYPAQLSFCMKINLKFMRYMTYTGLVYIKNMETGEILFNVEISNSRGYNFLVQFPGRRGEFEWHFGKERLRANFLRKWTWLCFSMDFYKQMAHFAVNGNLLETLHEEKLSKDIPSCEQCLLVLGQFWIDSNPLIGDLLEFSVWNNTLSEEDMKNYSDCKKFVKVGGNLLGKISDMNLQGSLIEPIRVDEETVQCSEESRNIVLHVPGEFKTFENAMNACNKLRYGSMGKDFSSVSEFMKFYEVSRNNKAIARHSWAGGRIPIFMPYMSRTSGYSADDFVHYISNKTMLKELWMKQEPKTKRGRYITLLLLGKDPSKTTGFNGVRNFYPEIRDWPASSFCQLPNTEVESIVVVLRGLCKNSVIDKFYQVRNDRRGYVIYYGFENTVIYYQQREARWALKLVNNKEVTGTVNVSLNSLALGNHRWTIREEFKIM